MHDARTCRGLKRSGRSPSAWLVIGLMALVLVSHAFPAYAYTPESPEVRKLIDSGLEYLDKNSKEQRLGGQCLIALAFLKDGRGDHRFIEEAIKACEETAASRDVRDDRVYSFGLAVIFLAEHDAKRHRKLIDYYLSVMRTRQKGHGGWGYTAEPMGDISQTQYGALSLWEVYQKGIPVNSGEVERAARWLMATQEPSGAWSYKPQVDDKGKPFASGHTTCSTVAAGMGSLLICADLFGILSPAAKSEAESNLPGAVKIESARDSSRPRLSGSLNNQQFLETVRRGNAWMDKNYVVSLDNYTSYYMYALERYKSLQEILEGTDDPEPEWYNNGVKYLMKEQDAEGWWSSGCGAECDTAFSILFLLRSMKTALGEGLGEGLAIGMQGGLPKDLSKLKVRGDKIVSEQPKTEISELIGMLDDEDKMADLEALMNDPSALIVKNVDEKDIRRLRQLVRGGDPIPRFLAVRALGHTGDFDNVPTLIYALTLEDRRTVLEARDGLRFISRRFEGFGLPDNYDDRQKFDAIDKWKKWYRSVRPDARLTDE